MSLFITAELPDITLAAAFAWSKTRRTAYARATRAIIQAVAYSGGIVTTRKKEPNPRALNCAVMSRVHTRGVMALRAALKTLFWRDSRRCCRRQTNTQHSA